MFRDRRILVTGATGLIGSHLVRRLLAEGAAVVAMSRSADRLRDVFQTERSSPALSLVTGDVTQAIPSVGEVDFCFHAASPISGAEIQSRPVDTISANLDGTKHCLEYLRRQKRGRMVLFSSATVYGTCAKQEESCTETQTDRADALEAANAPYAESKRMAEVLARAYFDQYGVESVIARIGFVYGFADPAPKTAFYEFVQKAIRGETIVLNRSGMGRRDNIYVSDAVEGLLTVAEKGAPKEAYNLASNGEKGGFRAIDEIAVMIAESVDQVCGEKATRVVVAPVEERAPGICLNNQKARSLGWKVQKDLKDGILETVRKYVESEGKN